MASGDGITYMTKSLTYPKYPVYDLILCADFDDVLGFFSLRELAEGLKDIRETGFIYNIKNDLKFSKDIEKKLASSNSFIGVQNSKIRIKKKNLAELFKLVPSEEFLKVLNKDREDRETRKKIEEKIKMAFKYNTGSNLLYHLQQINDEDVNLLKDDILKFINFKARKDKVFIFRSVVYNKNTNTDNYEFVEKSIRIKGEKCKNTRASNITKDFLGYKFCKESAFINPNDMVNFYKYFGKTELEIALTFLRQHDFPRLCTKSLLQRILKDPGVMEIDSGNLCFDIEKVDIEDKKELVEGVEKEVQVFKFDKRKKEELTKSSYGLFQNITIKGDKIKDINTNVFDGYITSKNKLCEPKNFRRDDTIIGRFNNGIYETFAISDIEEEKNREVDYFQKSVKSDLVAGFKEEVKNNLVNWYRKNRLYPRKGDNYLVIRDGIIKPQFLIGELTDSKIFVRAFQNTLSRVNVKNEIFGLILLQSLVYWIQVTYEYLYSRTGSTFRSYFKSINEYLLYGRSRGYDYYYINKLLTEITGKTDPYENIVDFLNSERLQTSTKEELQPLRAVSAFILCGVNDNCDEISVSSDNEYRVRFISDDVYVSLRDDHKNPIFENNYIARKSNGKRNPEDITQPFKVKGEIFKLKFLNLNKDKRKDYLF